MYHTDGVGGRGVYHLQDFELVQSRQGFGVDEWQVISRKSSIGEKENTI